MQIVNKFTFATIFVIIIGLVFKKEYLKEVFQSKKIVQIQLLNNKNISKSYFFEKLQVKKDQNFWLFNPLKLKRNLESFNEIENFSFSLSWSGVLKISINEKEPFMIWVNDNQKSYIDENGKIMKINLKNSDLKLINLFGKDVNNLIPNFSKVLQNNLKIYNDIKNIFFENNIGWKVQLKNNNCVYFPLKKVEQLVGIFENIYESDLYDEFTLFDLRIDGRVYMSNKEKC